MVNNDTAKRLWDIATDLRANSHLTSAEYAFPVLGLIFLRYADFKFTEKEKELEKKSSHSRRKKGKLDYQAEGVPYLTESSRFQYLLNLSESANIGEAIDSAMQQIEDENSELKEILPRGYAKFSNELLVTLLKNFSKISTDEEGDIFGKIYEYFLGKFAMSDGQGAGEFFTPTSIVKLIVEIIEPYHGKILDPACGSGGMFVQSANFVERQKKKPSEELSLYGAEKTFGTVKLSKMNLSIHGLSGDIREANSYYEDVHKSMGRFDFVMANPPFNVKKVDYEKVKGDPRWDLGLPSADNANYLWIQLFYNSLNKKGRAGFVMANPSSDARGNEFEIRKKMILSNGIDVIIGVSPKFFYTVPLPITLWFLDKNKINTSRKDKILFIDARKIFHQIDKAHREFTLEQIQEIADIVKSYRNEKGCSPYADMQGRCKVATFKEIEAEGWSLNPGIYIEVIKKESEIINFKEKILELNEALKLENQISHQLEKKISQNLINILNQNEKNEN